MKKMLLSLLAVLLAAAPGLAWADDRVATLSTSDLQDFDQQPAAVKRLLTRALELTTQNLSYKYGSSDPKEGGMDCSGTVYYLLAAAGIKDPPRDSGEMYRWVWSEGHFYSVESARPDSFEYSRLKPGDLLFWTGTYDANRDPPVSHVMIYLGINRATGRRVMVGASEGRRFNDVSRYGVSVFDLELPHHGPGDSGTSRFIGYGAIPTLVEVR
jgi:cell wall-associated NlpC family hydrolase